MQVPKIISNTTHNFFNYAFTAKHNDVVHNESEPIRESCIYPYIPTNTNNYNNISKVFEGMTQKEINFIINNLSIIGTTRGCPNRCLHCYANALPVPKEHDNFISRMPYEDYVNLINGIGAAKKGNTDKTHHKLSTLNIYFDSDCMELGLFDKQGKFHDYTDLHKIYYNATGEYTLFDTAGWNYKQPEMQERAEKYVQYLGVNNDKFYQINLSLSPFSPLYAKSIEYKYNPQNYYVSKLSEPPKTNGEKLYREYIERTANMLYTFTPLIDYDNFGIIVRPVDNNKKNMEEFSINAYKQTRLNVLNRLYQKYREDFEGEQKYIKSERAAVYYLQKYMDLMSVYDTKLVNVGRYKELFESRNPDMNREERASFFSQNKEKEDIYERLKENLTDEYIHRNYKAFMDIDGRVYLFDTYHFIPTELQVKLSTNDKITPALTPKPVEDFVLTREMINNL